MSTKRGRREDGFTLIETMVAMGILTVGLLGLAQAFYLGMSHLSTSSANLVAREKAREAVESVHTARDTGNTSWDQIRNEADGGVFLDDAQALRGPGADGLVNTEDDADAPEESQVEPGPDGVFGTDDDIEKPLAGFTRLVEIRELNPVNADLRELVVTIAYDVGPQRRTYVLRTFISRFS